MGPGGFGENSIALGRGVAGRGQAGARLALLGAARGFGSDTKVGPSPL